MKLDHDALRAACFELARAIRWKNDPVDEVIARAMVEMLYREAIFHEEFLVGQGRDPNIIVRAVRYLALKHAIPPMGENPGWFRSMLEVLVELACPNQGVSPDQESFFRDLEAGIAGAREDYAS